MKRILTITTSGDWKAGLRQAGAAAMRGVTDDEYQGEILNFETPDAFFSRLTSNRWKMIAELQGAGEIGVRALARLLGRDVKRVHEDATVLVQLGLLERSAMGKLSCPYHDIHVDMHLATQPA